MLSTKYLPHREENEETILFIKRHWFIAFKHILFFILLALLPFILFYLLNNGVINFDYSNAKSAFLYMGASIYYLFIWLFFFNLMLDFYLDVWIVTNRRIISIEQRGLFARVIAEQRLARVQDVTSDVQGMFPTFFRYGTVHIQTAGAVSRFVFKEVPNAREIAKQIIILANKRKQKEGNQPPV